MMIHSTVTSSFVKLVNLDHRQNRQTCHLLKQSNHRSRVLSCTASKSEYNREEEVKAFDETKTGVKGIVDAGALKVPKIFIRPSNERHQLKSDSNPTHFQIPVIDLQGNTHSEKARKEIVDQVRSASEKWGFFQVVNHGVPTGILEEMTKGVLRFHEQDDQVKKEFYTRDRNRRVRFNSNFDLYKSEAASWRDSVTFDMFLPDPIDPSELPAICRDITVEYTNHLTGLGDKLFQLLSEAIGLKPDYLKEMNCAESCVLICHYYPACPEPELTLGSATHTDPAFLTIVLQNDVGGLQVLHQNHWVDIHPIPGALVVNIGDFLQITSNDKLKSVKHRVLASHAGPRVSVPCFLTKRFNMIAEPIGPIKELISNGESRVYGDILMKDYIDHFASQGLDGKSGLECFKL